MSKISDVDIVNLALDRIAQDTHISSLSEGTETAAKCKRNYNFVLREILQMGRWKSARVKVKLAQRTDLQDPAFPPPSSNFAGTLVGGWPPGNTDYNVYDDGSDPTYQGPFYGSPEMPYAFQLPQDYVRIVRFNDIDSWASEYPFWEIRGDILWANQTTAFLEYVRDVSMPGIPGSNPPVVGTLDPLLQDALITGLAARLSFIFQNSVKQQGALLEEFMLKTRKAMAVDARSEKVALRSNLIDSTWIRSRWFSTNY